MVLARPATAETFKIATYNTELFRKGPGLLLRDILRGDDPQIEAVVAQIADVDPDVIALQGIDYDLENRALHALADQIAARGPTYPYVFTAPPNAGRATDLDLDGDGKTGGPADAQGYGRFFGQGSMAILSKHPFISDLTDDFTGLLWRDHPNPLIPTHADGRRFPTPDAFAAQRLFSHGAWSVAVDHPAFGQIRVLTYHATQPVFDGPEDRNGKRSHDETTFWLHLLDGDIGQPPMAPFVLMGDANLDPERGDGIGSAMAALLAHPALQDPLPGQPTVTFSRTGPLRVDYVLPSAGWQVRAAQVVPPDPEASRHSLVWVELTQ